MHSRDKGKSGSTRPSKLVKPTWIRYNEKEVIMIIEKLTKEGYKPSMIGMILRDTYGIPSVRLVTGKKITQILEEKGLKPKLPEDLVALMRKAVNIRKHMEKNKQDMSAKRGLQLTESKILRLVKYYKRTNKIPADWKYNPKDAQMYI